LPGVLILVAPRFLNYVVAAYLILVGILGLGLIRRAISRQPSPPVSGRGRWGPRLIVIRSGLFLIYRSLAPFGHESRVDGATVDRG
jgi:Protein of unknown function (DUF3096)